MIDDPKCCCFDDGRATADAIVAQNLATRADIDAALTQLRTYASDPSTLVGDPRLFQVWAHRSRAGT
ncbi:MAG TPA: hypothetical protein VIM49_09115 [Dermatophilaceae bacterium]